LSPQFGQQQSNKIPDWAWWEGSTTSASLASRFFGFDVSLLQRSSNYHLIIIVYFRISPVQLQVLLQSHSALQCLAAPQSQSFHWIEKKCRVRLSQEQLRKRVERLGASVVEQYCSCEEEQRGSGRSVPMLNCALGPCLGRTTNDAPGPHTHFHLIKWRDAAWHAWLVHSYRSQLRRRGPKWASF
jgi:hypothetical protein